MNQNAYRTLIVLPSARVWVAIAFKTQLLHSLQTVEDLAVQLKCVWITHALLSQSILHHRQTQQTQQTQYHRQTQQTQQIQQTLILSSFLLSQPLHLQPHKLQPVLIALNAQLEKFASMMSVLFKLSSPFLPDLQISYYLYLILHYFKYFTYIFNIYYIYLIIHTYFIIYFILTIYNFKICFISFLFYYIFLHFYVN